MTLKSTILFKQIIDTQGTESNMKEHLKKKKSLADDRKIFEQSTASLQFSKTLKK